MAGFPGFVVMTTKPPHYQPDRDSRSPTAMGTRMQNRNGWGRQRGNGRGWKVLVERGRRDAQNGKERVVGGGGL